MRGRVNHMTREEVQQAPDVVLGMFLASSHPATILSNSGASHSMGFYTAVHRRLQKVPS
jgi:hypothetical protein